MKKQKEKKKALKKVNAQAPEPALVPKDDPFDYGGLPKRDLKKNLGCG
jgi:hypothetical protein